MPPLPGGAPILGSCSCSRGQCASWKSNQSAWPRTQAMIMFAGDGLVRPSQTYTVPGVWPVSKVNHTRCRLAFRLVFGFRGSRSKEVLGVGSPCWSAWKYRFSTIGKGMGGHGGLNILGHKSWNVYGKKQRKREGEGARKKLRKTEEETAGPAAAPPSCLSPS